MFSAGKDPLRSRCMMQAMNVSWLYNHIDSSTDNAQEEQQWQEPTWAQLQVELAWH